MNETYIELWLQVEASLRAEPESQHEVAIAAAIIEQWLTIAEWNYGLEWWEFCPAADSAQDASEALARRWLIMHERERSSEARKVL